MQTKVPPHRTAWKQTVFSMLFAPPIFFAIVGNAIAATAQPADLIVSHAYVVTMNASKEIYSDGAVVIKDGHIIAIGPNAIASGYVPARTIDAAGDIVMPGMINTHTHASMTVFRGLGDDVPDRLQRFIFPLEHKLVDREIVYWGALYGMVEMVEGGVTTVADMYYPSIAMIRHTCNNQAHLPHHSSFRYFEKKLTRARERELGAVSHFLETKISDVIGGAK